MRASEDGRLVGEAIVGTPPLVTSKIFAEQVVTADEVVSRQARSGEARRSMAIKPFAPKDYARARETFGALRDGFPLQ